MNNNDVLINLRDILELSDEKVIEVFALANIKVKPEELSPWLKRSDEAGHADLSDKMTANFLNAVVTYKRGPDESGKVRPLETPMTNNIVLKKLRVAFELKEEDIAALVKKTESTTTPQEWSAYFRAPDHKNYRACPDTFLAEIFRGLANSK